MVQGSLQELLLACLVLVKLRKMSPLRSYAPFEQKKGVGMYEGWAKPISFSILSPAHPKHGFHSIMCVGALKGLDHIP